MAISAPGNLCNDPSWSSSQTGANLPTLASGKAETGCCFLNARVEKGGQRVSHIHQHTLCWELVWLLGFSAGACPETFEVMTCMCHLHFKMNLMPSAISVSMKK